MALFQIEDARSDSEEDDVVETKKENWKENRKERKKLKTKPGIQLEKKITRVFFLQISILRNKKSSFNHDNWLFFVHKSCFIWDLPSFCQRKKYHKINKIAILLSPSWKVSLIRNSDPIKRRLAKYYSMTWQKSVL